MKEIEAIKQALAAEPTPGPWFVSRAVNDDGTVDIETGRIARDEWPPAQNCEFPTCHYIAACNPAAMTAVLAHTEAQDARLEQVSLAGDELLRLNGVQRAEIERLRAESDERLKNTVAQAMEIERLRDALLEIGNAAHDASTGPAVPDALWEIRNNAYAAM